MKKLILLIVLFLTFNFYSCNINDDLVVDEVDDSESIDKFYEELFVELLMNNPEYVDVLGDLSEYGVYFQKDLLTDSSDEYYIELEKMVESALLKLDSYKDSDDYDYYINKENVKWYLELELENLKYRKNIFFISHIIGDHRSLYDLLNEVHLVENLEDAENLIKRFRASGKKLDELANRYTFNAAEGYIMDPVSVDYTLSQVRGMYKSNVEFMELYKSFESKIENLDIDLQKKDYLLSEAVEALQSNYIPGMEKLKQALLESKKLSNDPLGVWNQPNGEEYYIHALKKHTTTEMTPEEIHQLGLSEVARIRAEMKKRFLLLDYEGDLNDMLNELYKNGEVFRGEDVMKRYVDTAAYMETRLNEFFNEEDLPVSSPDIRVSPGGNFYTTPSIDGKRPGIYYLDIGSGHYDMGINTLAYHETVPGHHLEREHELYLENIPMVRKLAFNTAYIEGWALYAEMLADEYGFNDTPEKQIGYLKSELHRAARLVADTGIHYKKWTRAQAVDYLVDEGLLNRSYAQNEVTRYTSWPGQACSYKIGQLKILELRELAESKLGTKYNIKDFHSSILSNGSMPLKLLEEQVKMYIEETK